MSKNSETAQKTVETDAATKTDAAQSDVAKSDITKAESTHDELVKDSPLHTDHGVTTIAEQVVQKVAGMACREVMGVHAMGSAGRRMLNSLTERIPGSSTNVSGGVTVEKGERQTAIDVSIIVEYGFSVVEIANEIRRNIIEAVEYATGLEVVEVNVAISDVHLPGDSQDDENGDSSDAAVKPRKETTLA